MTDEHVITGLAGLEVTAAVTEDPYREVGMDQPHLNPVVVVPPAPPAAPMPEGWTIHRVSALVRDIAMNMYELPFTLSKHSLTTEQYATLTGNEFFRRALEAATMEWNSPLSTTKRLAMEAAVALEDALPDVASRLRKTNEPLPGVVELCKLFAKMAGVGEQAARDNAPQERFKITINLGADLVQFDKVRGPQTLTIQQESEGAGAQSPLQQFLQAP